MRWKEKLFKILDENDLVHIQSNEYSRMAHFINEYSRRIDNEKIMVLWSSVRGEFDYRRRGNYSFNARADPKKMLEKIQNERLNLNRNWEDEEVPYVYVFYNFHRFMNDEDLNDGVAELLLDLYEMGKKMVIISPIVKIPVALNDIMVVVTPENDREDYVDVVRGLSMCNKIEKPSEDAVIDALEGLTMGKAEDLISLCFICKRAFDVDFIKEEKKNFEQGYVEVMMG